MTLTAHDAGRSASVKLGDLVEVTLLGKDGPSGGWPELNVAGDALSVLTNPANTATVGTRLGEYCAARRGRSTLTSGAWRVSVTVS